LGSGQHLEQIRSSIDADRHGGVTLGVVADRVSELLRGFEYAYGETEHDELFQSLATIGEGILDSVLELRHACRDDADVPDSLSIASTYLGGVGHIFAAMQALGDSSPGKWAADCRATTLRLLEQIATTAHSSTLIHRTEFSRERQLRDFIATNLPTMPGHRLPLALFNANGQSGIEYQTDVGRIDILAIANDALYVIELKRGMAMDTALGQLLRYMGWVRERIAQGRPVFGVIVGASISETLGYAAAGMGNVHLMEYDFAFSLSSVAARGIA
jgi:hypothetical protein